MNAASLAFPDRPAVSALRRPQRMAVNVPTDLLRSFIAIVEAGSMAQATETIFLTQSALSLQMKRLEDLLQQRLFNRKGRSLTLTAAGEELFGLARQLLALNDRIILSLGAEIEPEPIQLGLVQDFADTLLPDVLTAFAQAHPRLRLQLRVAGSAELLEQFDRAKLDIVLCLGRHGELRRATSQVVAEVPMAWVGQPHLALLDELPLVLLDQPCAFRTAMLDTLERAGRPYRIVLEASTLPGLRAALRAGIGISCRTAGYAAAETLPMPAQHLLPSLPRIDHVLLCRDPVSDVARELADRLEEAAREAAPARLSIVPA